MMVNFYTARLRPVAIVLSAALKPQAVQRIYRNICLKLEPFAFLFLIDIVLSLKYVIKTNPFAETAMSIESKTVKDLSLKLLEGKDIPCNSTRMDNIYLGMPIPRRFPLLGDSGNRGMAICHSSGIGETKTYSPGFGFGVRGISGSILFQI